MDSTVTLKTTTRWDGGPVAKGRVFRVPTDIDLVTARRWIRKGIAVMGGEWVPSATERPKDDIPFQELERELGEEREEQIATLAKRSKAALLEIASARLIPVDERSNREEIARMLIDTPES